VIPVMMNFSAQTQSLVVQQTIESKLEKKRKNLLGAPSGMGRKKLGKILYEFLFLFYFENNFQVVKLSYLWTM
jgi:P-loop containing dynein motor region